MTTTRTRQMIEAEAARNADLPGVLAMLRREWKSAPVGMCDTKDHGDRVAAGIMTVAGGSLHTCQECVDYFAAAAVRNNAKARAARSQAALGGMTGQTRHRQ